MKIIESDQSDGQVTVINTGACYDCGGRCVLKVHVKDGVAIRVETDDGEEPQLRACLRGRAFRKHVYSPERLQFPLKRVGPRGEGRFERISWDEALDTVANELTRIKETYGPSAILLHAYSSLGAYTLHGYGGISLHQLLGNLGGFITTWGGASYEGSVFNSRATYGTLSTGHTRDDLLNSRMILLWGMNPADSIFGTNTAWYVARAREAGARVVVVDPRHTKSAAVLADQWIPIRPGTDAALLLAMAYVIIAENLHDRKFLDTYTVGFEKFKDYIMGKEDGTAKTPAWGETKTGVPADIIASLARDYAVRKPAALIPGFAAGRSLNGEQFHRAASTLTAMTGNVGIHGGAAAGFDRGPVGAQIYSTPMSEAGTSAYADQLKALDIPRRLRKRPHTCRIWDAIIEGTAGGFPSDIKMAYVAFSNPLNQLPNINKGVEALKKLEFIVVHEQFMNPTAKFADILLPVATHWERNDISRPWLSGPYFLYLNKVIDPLSEVKTDLEICRELAHRLGISIPLFEMSEEEGIDQVKQSMGDLMEEVRDFEKFKKDGVHKMKLPAPQLCFKEQIENPEDNPFPTPSGKIEIFCQRIADLNDPGIPSIPKYLEPFKEGPDDPLAEAYPLQLITIHHRTRAHSSFDNNPWLKDLEPQRLWLNTDDARSRGIEDGQMVRVFNDRGETLIPAKVTQRIMPGVVSLGQGAWYQPDEKGRDRAGSANVLTQDRYSPGGAFPFNTNLVEVERFTEEGEN